MHPLGVGAPFFPSLPLEQHGLEWIHPPAALAHPFDNGPPAMLYSSIEETGRTLDVDAERYDRLIRPLVEHWEEIAADSLGPVHLPKHPLVMARFGLSALKSMRSLAESRFRGEQARGLMAGLGAHSIMPLTHIATASIGLVLATVAHRSGWPSPKGGAQRISDALASYLRSLGGVIETNAPVASLAELPSARVVLLDLTARNALEVGGDAFSARYRESLLRYRLAPGVCKVDWALSAAVPWRDDECATAGTVHLGGSLNEFVTSEAAPWRGEHAERPFVLLAQPSLFDATRAPAGSHTLWAYVWANGPLDDLVNNAAGNFIARSEELTPRAVDAVLGIVLHGSAYCTIACGRRWLAEGRKASVLSIITTYAWTGSAYVVPSAMAKARRAGHDAQPGGGVGRPRRSPERDRARALSHARRLGAPGAAARSRAGLRDARIR